MAELANNVVPTDSVLIHPDFHYDVTHQVVVCKACKFCILPRAQQITKHLRDTHRYTGEAFKAAQQYLCGLMLLVPSEANLSMSATRQERRVGPAIPFLKTFAGVVCQHCGFCTWENLRYMRSHMMTAHAELVPVKRRSDGKGLCLADHWQKHCVQRFFEPPQYRQYFPVSVDTNALQDPRVTLQSSLQKSILDLADQCNMNTVPATEDLPIKAGHELHFADRLPWVDELQVAEHLRGMKSKTLRTYIQLTLPQDDDKIFPQVQARIDKILRTAYKWSSSRLSAGMREKLNHFNPVEEAMSSTFRRKKQEKTLIRYFSYWQGLVSMVLRLFLERQDREECGSPASSPRSNCASRHGVSSDDGDGDDDGSIDVPHHSNTAIYRASSEHEDTDATESQEEGDNRWPADITRAEREYWSPPWLSDRALQHLVGNVLAQPDRRAPVVALLVAMVTQVIGAKSFLSPLASYVAVQAVTDSGRGWREPGNLASTISGIIFGAQLILIYETYERVSRKACCWPSQANEQFRIANQDDIFEELLKQYMVNDRSTACSLLLFWRPLLRHYSASSVSANDVVWSECLDCITYNGKTVSMRKVRGLYCLLVQACQEVLQAKLMLDCPQAAENMKSCRKLKDSQQDGSHGHWFLLDKQNNAYLAECNQKVLLRHVLLLHQEQAFHPDGSWQESYKDMYELFVQDFLEQLLLLVHISGGTPVRAPELLTVTWRNTVTQTRSLRIVDGQMMVHITYHKGKNITNQDKHNVRFLPDVIADLIVNFLIYVQPLRNQMHSNMGKDFYQPYHLWSNANGESLSSELLTRSMQKCFPLAGLPVVSVAPWRMICTAIVKKHFEERQAILFHVANGGAAFESTNNAVAALHLQSNHTTKTANMAYANSSGCSSAGTWDALVTSGRMSSRLWQKLFRFDQQELTLAPGGTRLGIKGTVQKDLEHTRIRLLEALRKLYKSPQANWTCKDQQEALFRVCNPHKYPEVLVVLGTGAGKSLCFMLPAFLDGARLTVVIVPLIVLKLDLLKRCKESGIAATLYYEAMPSVPSQGLVLVSTETASRPRFMQELKRLESIDCLDRIVIDEAHMIFTTVDYRKKMEELVALREIRTQFVYLSATVPPCLEDMLVAKHYLHASKLQVIRGMSDRANLAYQVVMLPDSPPSSFSKPIPSEDRGRLLAIAANFIQQHIRESTTTASNSNSRYLVFCRSRESAEILAAYLDCNVVHAQSGSSESKIRATQAWAEEADPCAILVGTSALGAGYDCRHVRSVFHVEEPYSLIDFVQEIGRAGRDGLPATSYVLLQNSTCNGNGRPPYISKDMHDELRGYMQAFLEVKTCLRYCLVKALDHRDLECGETNRCTFCLRPKSPLQQLQTSIDLTDYGWDDSWDDGLDDGPELNLPPAKRIKTTAGARHQLSQKQLQESCHAYIQNLRQVLDKCVFCLSKGLLIPRNNNAHSCADDMAWREFRAAHYSSWRMTSYHTCYKCYQPQRLVCRKQQDPEGKCNYPFIVAPVAFAMYHNFQQELQELVQDTKAMSKAESYMIWCFKHTSLFGGEGGINGVRVVIRWFELLKARNWLQS